MKQPIRITSVRRLVGSGIIALLTSMTVHAASFPERPITLIVPYPPGGSADLSARIVAFAMEKTLKQTIVVENRAGGSGTIGMGVLAHAKPDGYTIGLGAIGTQTINQFLYKDRNYNTETDFAPIAVVMTTPNVIAVSKNSKIKNLHDLIAAAKQGSKDGNKELSYATSGVGSSVHLTAAYFEQIAGVNMLHVPFRGAAQSIPAAIGGQVDIVMDNLPSSLGQLKDGSKLRGIAVTSAERSPALPDLPTVAESGLPGFDVVAWFSLYAPSGTPEPVMNSLIGAAKAALESPEVKSKFISTGASAGTLFGKDMIPFEQKQRARWSKLIKDRGITAE